MTCQATLITQGGLELTVAGQSFFDTRCPACHNACNTSKGPALINAMMVDDFFQFSNRTLQPRGVSNLRYASHVTEEDSGKSLVP